MTGILHEDQCTYKIVHRSVLREKNVSDSRFIENQNTHFMFNNFFFNHAVYEIMWKNIVEPDRPRMTIWHMRAICRILCLQT